MKKYSKLRHTLALTLGLALIASPLMANAAAGDWQINYRNPDDTEYVPMNIPVRSTSSPALLGGVKNSDLANWYYFGPCFQTPATTTTAYAASNTFGSAIGN